MIIFFSAREGKLPRPVHLCDNVSELFTVFSKKMSRLNPKSLKDDGFRQKKTHSSDKIQLKTRPVHTMKHGNDICLS